MYFWLRGGGVRGEEGREGGRKRCGGGTLGWIKKNFNDWACFKLS